MATVHLILCFVYSALIGGSSLHRRDLLRERLIDIAGKETGVLELTNQNDGAQVEAYLSIVKLKRGAPWCGAFLSWIYAKAGLLQPRTAWSPDFFPLSRLTSHIQPGNVIGIYFPKLRRIAHVGLVTGQRGQWVYTIEGNTTGAGPSKNEGVFKKIRHLRTIHRIADWVSERRTER